jgi:hypothetical protein
MFVLHTGDRIQKLGSDVDQSLDSFVHSEPLVEDGMERQVKSRECVTVCGILGGGE